MPGRLELSFNASKLGDFMLDKEVLTIGRKDDNDICIENLAVSGHHAKLLTIFDDSFLEDLDSTNGTYVNGIAVKKHPLQSGDVIVIGKHELRYVNETKAIIEDDEKTILVKPKQDAAAPAPAAPAPTPANNDPIDFEPSRPEPELAKLQILNGSGAGKELPLVKPSVRLGRAGCEVVQINKRPDGHFIVSLDQSEDSIPPTVNGEVIGSRSMKLENHDVIEINRLKIEYFLG